MPNHPPSSNRRAFLRNGSSAIAAGSLAATLGSARAVHAQGSDTIRVGLIGCGGRGSGAAINAMRADKNLKLTAMADLFEDRLRQSQRIVRSTAESSGMGEKYDVDEDHGFFGFDAYQKVIDSGVDVVILAATPHFRPRHLEAAIAAGKHVFCEKPVAVDATGVRRVLNAVEEAEQKQLNLVSGLCWRYDYGVRETVKRIKDGAIGDLVAIHTNYLTGGLWHRGRKPEWSEMEYQIRNWLYFSWLSGDHIVEQHIHSLDKAVWLMDDQLPESCFGLGGRLVRTDEKYGDIYDHHAVCYQYPNGLKVFAYTRQMNGCFNQTDDFIYGTQGTGTLLANTINGKEQWKYSGPSPSMYDVEHAELFAAIRAGTPINNGQYMARSTMMAIMGREACYTGKLLKGEEALQSQQKLGPDTYAFGDAPAPRVALPG